MDVENSARKCVWTYWLSVFGFTGSPVASDSEPLRIRYQTCRGSSITSISNCCGTEHYSYSRLIRKQAIWPSDKKDEAEGEVTHSQDSREPDGATKSWRDCQHTLYSWQCVCVCVCVCVWDRARVLETMCECVLFAVCSVVFMQVRAHMCVYKRLLIVCLLRYLGVC